MECKSRRSPPKAGSGDSAVLQVCAAETAGKSQGGREEEQKEKTINGLLLLRSAEKPQGCSGIKQTVRDASWQPTELSSKSPSHTS